MIVGRLSSAVVGNQPAASKVSPAVDAIGIRAPIDRDGILDVYFDDRRIWSIDRSMRASDDDDLVPWPASLHPFLDGTTRVTARRHGTGAVVFDFELTVGTGSQRIKVVDDEGNSLALNKWGELVQPFDSKDESAIQATLEQTAQALGVLRDECGLPAFVTYGTLLGAVRGGELIGHDDDVDVAYLSAREDVVAVIRESFEIERVFRRKGWAVKRFSGGFLQVSFAGPDGVFRYVDVFTCFHAEGRFYQAFAVGADLARAAILPLGTVSLHARQMPAPANPDALLAATYGADWRVPDPSFQFKSPRATKRRIGGWLGGYHVNIKYWDEFYRSRRSDAVPQEPSAFARWVGDRESEPTSLVEVGCGTGRDALWFAREGHEVLALDYAPAAIEHGRATVEAEKLPAGFEPLDLYDLRQVMTFGAQLAHNGSANVLYGRFLVHALEDAGRHNLWRLAEMVLRPGGSLYLEFRTGEDADQPHAFGEHFRRYLSPDLVVHEIEERGGRIEHREEGYGLAVYKDEDPHVARLVAGWPG